MDRSDKRNILLEYCSKGQHFHYNFDEMNNPNDSYYPLGWCSYYEASAFTRVVYPFILKDDPNEPDVPNEKVIEAWNLYCDLIESNLISITEL